MAESIRITLVALFFFRMCVGGRFTGEIGFDTLLERVIMIIQLYLPKIVKYMKQFWAEIAARMHQFIVDISGGNLNQFYNIYRVN